MTTGGAGARVAGSGKALNRGGSGFPKAAHVLFVFFRQAIYVLVGNSPFVNGWAGTGKWTRLGLCVGR